LACSLPFDPPTIFPGQLDIQPGTAFNQILSVARQNDLTEYDAAYIELALREGFPLATLDDKLRRAATRVGISLVAI